MCNFIFAGKRTSPTRIKFEASLIEKPFGSGDNQQLSFNQQPIGRRTGSRKNEAWLAGNSAVYFLLQQVSPSPPCPPRQPDRMGREPKPPRRKSEAKRNGEGRQGEGTPERFSTLLLSRSFSGGETNK